MKIRVRGLRKAFDGQQVLAGIDLDVAAGENLVLLGRSGTGKSVLLRCILGLIEPDAGSIEIDGHETVGIDAAARETLMRRIGVLFQNGALFDSLPVWENVAFELLNTDRMRQKEARSVALEKLASVGLGPDVADLLPAELSGGMQKRVALARAVCRDPEILILDAPTAGLDPIITTIVDQLIVGQIRRLQATAITVTHDLASARRTGDRIAVLAKGRIIWQGLVGDVEQSGDPEIDELLRRGGWRFAA